MSRVNFESTLEKIGRIIGRSYNLEVLFEGNEAYTDGKRIVLPFFQTIDEEMKADLNGYLDHEAAHCLFTGFETLKKIKTRFHKEMLNAVEDVRIERLMQEEYPGTAFHLRPLNDKMRARVMAEENWSRLPWPIRTILAVRDIMEGRAPRIDEDIERFVDVVKDAAVELNDCKSTEELRVKTEEIVKKIIEEREEERKESGDGEQEEGEEGDSSESKAKGKGGEGDSEGEDSEGEDDSEGDDSGAGGADSKFDSMLTEKEGDKKSEFDKHATSIHDMMKEKMDKALAEDKKSLGKVKPGSGHYPTPEFGTATSIPATTRFDKVTDHSGKGDIKSYARLKDSVRPKVAPIKNALERVLKVRENAKWKTERERGNLNARDLSRLASDRSYRTPFKEFTRTETNNVAVELLIDLSGSMAGHRIQVAKMSAIAISEALKDLQIPFEVTGFCSEPDRRVSEYTASLADSTRFNRKHERLDLHVFKRFDSHTLLGLEAIKNGSQNPDGECVAWAAKRLAERKEKRKILMVLSDGQPATGDGDHRKLCTDLKKKIELISKSGIEIIGVGIETDHVKHFYPDFVILRDVDELPKAGLAKLSKLIQQG
jgi:cobalamin biosynthesis protein CobT